MSGESSTRPWKRASFGVAVLAAVAVAVHLPIPGFTDGDSLYHIRHAWIYRTRGLGQSAFPWLPFSVIEREASNLWYGFHVLLLPFTFFEDLLVGIRVAGVVITTASLVLAWRAFVRLGVGAPLAWTLLFAFSSVDSLYRSTMVRPQPLSLGIAMLLFAHLASDRPSRRGVFALGAVFAWIHLSLAWLPAALWGVTTGARMLRKRKPHVLEGALLAVGLAIGAIARPNPIGALRLVTVQVPIWLAARGSTVLLHVGRELQPYEWSDLPKRLLPATVCALAAIALFLVRRPDPLEDDRRVVAGWASLPLVVGFFLMSFFVAKRANDLFIAFAAILAACASGPWIAVARAARTRAALLALAPLALGVVAAPICSLWQYRGYLQRTEGADPLRLREPALWLRDHARPGDIVFNANWDMFPRLFFWSPDTYCVSGNDPVFLYARDKELYWITRQLESDALIVHDGRGFVCGTPPCPREMLEDVRDALVKRFRASWVLVQRRRLPKLWEYLSKDARFEIAFQDGGETVFRIRT